MKRRCLNPKAPNYRNYGGRGIKVCGRWMIFQNFFADIGERPPGHSIERIDVNGDYCPENCKWIPSHLQARNRRASVKVLINGVETPLREACQNLGLNYRTVLSRVNILKWTREEALGLCTRIAHRAHGVSGHFQEEAA